MSLLFKFLLSLLIISLVSCTRSSLTHAQIHQMQAGHTMTKLGRSDPFHSHTLVFVIQQSNLDDLKTLVHDLSDPSSRNHRKWLTVDELHNMTVNQEGYDHVIKWLLAKGVSTASTATYTNYVVASAPIVVWEELLDIQFYEWHHRNTADETPVTVHRSDVLKLPKTMLHHVTTVFNTCQAMPIIHHRMQIKKASESDKSLFKADILFEEAPTNLRSGVNRKLAAGYFGISYPGYLKQYYNVDPTLQGVCLIS